MDRWEVVLGALQLHNVRRHEVVTSMKELILAQDVRSTGQIYVGWTAVIAPDEKALAEPGGQGRK